MDKELFENCDDPDHPAGAARTAKNHKGDADPIYPGLLDDDPALDFILLNEMEKEVRKGQPGKKGGCAGVLLLFLVPVSLAVWLIQQFLI